MTVAAIVETLAKEFSIQTSESQAAFDLLSSGSKAPYIARFRRTETGALTEGALRRYDRRRRQLEELDRRRATLLRSLETGAKVAGAHEVQGESVEAIRALLEGCMDKNELEDLFLAYRRPEPEVQLALDRGLDRLADEIVRPMPKSERGADDAPSSDGNDGEAAEADVEPQLLEPEPVHASVEEAFDALDAADVPADAGEAPSEHAAAEEHPLDVGEDGAAGAPDAAAEHATTAVAERSDNAARAQVAKLEFSPQLARLCAPYVNPDRGIHTDRQALEGAMRILADRLGRNPQVRGMIRHLVRKHGRLAVRSLVDEKKLGRYRSLLRMQTPLRQIQGHQLLSLRQAQIQRQVSATIEFDRALAIPKVRAILGRRFDPAYVGVVDSVVERAIVHRILPMIEEDMRAELRERADEEAHRFIAQHLRQVLLAPVGGRRRTAGVEVNAKGDWTIVVVDENGTPVPPAVKLEVGGKPLPELSNALGAALRDAHVRILALGHGKASREAVQKLRECIHALQAEAHVHLVNEAGLSSYANSESARKELAEFSVPERMAIGLARRHQDALTELLKTETRHLGLGKEQSVVSKSGLRRVLAETVESCVAAVGCDLNVVPLHVLRHVPGLDFETAQRIVQRRGERPFESREELLVEGVLDPAQWRNAIAFLRLRSPQEPLDRTALHPETYDVARRIIGQSGSSVEDVLGKRDATKGMRRADFDVDEATWRDLMREFGYPGRDPRLRTFDPQVLAPDKDPTTLDKDTVVEGIVSNVASFGAFVDLGIPRDGMIHISEISSRYVRDARGLLSIGQVVRARVLNGSGPRVELSLKNVPDMRRRPPRETHERPRRERDRSNAAEAWPQFKPVLRAAQSRRDGLGSGAEGRRGGAGGGGGGGRGPGRQGGGPGKGGRPQGRRGPGRDEGYDAAAVRDASRSAGTYNPFAAFFQNKGEKSEDEKPSAPQP